MNHEDLARYNRSVGRRPDPLPSYQGQEKQDLAAALEAGRARRTQPWGATAELDANSRASVLGNRDLADRLERALGLLRAVVIAKGRKAARAAREDAAEFLGVAPLAALESLDCEDPRLTPQALRVLDYLRKGHTLSPAEGRQVFRVERLAARIKELRNAGYVITKTMRKDATGKAYARYSMPAAHGADPRASW